MWLDGMMGLGSRIALIFCVREVRSMVDGNYGMKNRITYSQGLGGRHLSVIKVAL